MRTMLHPLFIMAVMLRFAQGATPPGQPTRGPGGREYRHAGVTKNVYEQGARQYWLFEPSDPAPESAPVVVFNHGWGAVNPMTYGAWIEHIVRRGNIVIYPRYQAKWRHPPGEITQNAVDAVKAAIGRLQGKGHVRPQLDKFAIVGHSAGGQITANMAALAASAGLPQPRAIMCVQPGKSWSLAKRIQIPLVDLSTIPEGALLLAVVGDCDNIARDIDAKRIFNESSRVPLANKDFVTIVTDRHGSPPLVADHFSPCAANDAFDSGEHAAKQEKDGPLRSRLRERMKQRRAKQAHKDGFPNLDAASRSVNALDYYGYWKLFDALCDAAFYGKNRACALGNTPQQRFMGTWSDGAPVKEAIVTDTP
ncbi:MAG: alpha/beta hydrolase fold domain-containing protein [Planctomycetes bacterium]|nr:alpha/beta hydrolase fold domain-containing protein [Planctomycetota bacterium]